MPAPANFHDVLLPIHIAVEIPEESGFQTIVHTAYSRQETRVQQTSEMLGRWEVSYSHNTKAKIAEAVHFAIGRRGRGYSFRFLDPNDHTHDLRIYDSTDAAQHEATFYEASGAVIFYTSTAGGETELQLTQPYGDATNPYYKPITKPVDAATYPSILNYDGDAITTPTWELRKNDVVLTGGGVDYTMDYDSGEITGLTGVIATDRFSWNGVKHKHVRFDKDAGQLVAMAGFLKASPIDASRFGPIPIVERLG